MTCNYGIITYTRDGDEFDCDLGLPNCDNCPFGPFPYDSLLVIVEDGSIDYLAHSGDWLTETGLNYLTSVFSEEIKPGLEMEPDANEAIEITIADPNRVFLITIKDPCWCFDSGYWDMNYGYVNPESHIEWDNVKVEEI